MVYSLFKTTLDRLVALVALVSLIPVFGLISLLISVFMGGKPFFSQKRAGLNGVVFKFYKFRSMTNQKDSQGKLLPDHMRITRLGNFLRKTSLDELPQLVNIVKGDMSFIGPRPLIASYLERYSTAQKRRHTVRPGITGLAQVKGRNGLSWEERFYYDVIYTETMSFLLDLKIVFLTIKTVVSAKGVNQKENITMHEYIGVGV
jgi:lipopolysaccharide/colanic/teichoic acid biosynthesis glycosyltransferase